MSEECRHCYIDGIMRRGGYDPFGGPMQTTNWANPNRWNKRATKLQTRYRVFTCSMSDFFHSGADEWRDEAWKIIRDCDRLDWLILTKRPGNICDRLPSDWENGYPNVWLGVTVGCTQSFNRLETLRSIPAQIKFVSAEPLFENIDLRPHLTWLSWVITGCERAAKEKRRLMDVDWVRRIDTGCKEFDVPHFFKQAYVNNKGTPCESPLLNGAVVQQFPTAL